MKSDTHTPHSMALGYCPGITSARLLLRMLLAISTLIITAALLSGCSDAADNGNENTSSDAGGISSGDAEVIGELETEPTYASEHDIPQLVFTTTDLDYNKVSSSDYSGAKLIMLNFWEPWCGPCLSEMADLEQLYEDYKDQGLVLIGAFGSTDMDDDARDIVKENGITYPILHCNTNMMRFATAYYPTTIFLDSDWNLLSQEAVIGAHSYEDYEKLVKIYLGESGETAENS